ncbi:MAG: sugar phosphate nucleotidyltransferase [archaeon]
MNKRSFIKNVEKSWGMEEWIVNKDYCGKMLTLKKGNQSSFHYHKNKDETFYVLSGKFIISDEKGEIVLNEGDILDVSPGQIHKIRALEDSQLIEFSTHHEDSDSYRIIRGGEVRTAVILCGGKVTRLKPLTYEIPKPLLPVCGKPILEHLFDLFKKYEIGDITLSVGYLKDKIKSHVGDGLKLGLRVSYIEEDEPLGTAGPLFYLKNKVHEPFIVSNGDELKNVNIDEMLENHVKNKALITIALKKIDNPNDYGVAKLDGDKIIEFVEKPPKGEEPSNFISAGFYIIDPKVLDYISKGFSMLEKDIFPRVAKEGKLYGYKFDTQWFDTGTMERYEIAIKNWKGIV